MRRPFSSWREFAEFLIFLGVCNAGIFNASWLWVSIGAMTLFLLGFSRWWATIAKAGAVDADLRELGRLAYAARLFGVSFELYAKSHNVPFVLAAKLGVDTLFLAGAFLFGRVMGWVWGVGADPFSIEPP